MQLVEGRKALIPASHLLFLFFIQETSIDLLENNLTFPQKVEDGLPYNQITTFLDIYPKDLKTGIQTTTVTQMLTAALFTITKRWKQPRCPLRDKWINKMGYIHTAGYCSIIKNSELLIHVDEARNYYAKKYTRHKSTHTV